MKLLDVIGKIEGIQARGNLNLEINEIRCDSRLVGSGDMFVAIVGFKTDGHNYVQMAVEKGATVIAVEDGHYDITTIPENIVVLVAPDTRKLLALAACNYYGNPSREFKLVGVTGTKGKTTTTYMIKSILEKAGKKVGLIGTIANIIGDKVVESQRTTPESIDLQKMFREMADSKVDVVVMEVSSHSLALDRVYGCAFDIAVFTNLTQDHLDFHGTFDNYLAAKAKLFTMAKEGYVNCDDMYAKKLMNMATCPITTYGIDNNPYVAARDIIITNSYSDFKLPFNKVIERIKVDIPGRFTVYNALAAICVSVRLGADFQNIIEGLENIKVPGRSEIVPTTRNFTVMVDYAHSPDSLENILKAVKSYTKGKVICVFGCGGDRDNAKRPMMGEISGKIAGFTVITSDNPRTEKPEEIVKQIEVGIKNTNGKYKVIIDRKKAIEYALRMAERNDLVLVAGKGHETYQEINGEKHHFDDREVIAEALLHLPPEKIDNRGEKRGTKNRK
ncbi:MAG: UDP-N-acetylmuramoyl-L-alanyl-D-glutamate--2,6-diaminopimelate ligase [Clostridia bacterium]|nr:UDP-N-acetylmuramoyl-L-alanyl-D-glutamate--2,6-diaminopimelate ligase [Clostridia bacterium]